MATVTIKTRGEVIYEENLNLILNDEMQLALG